MINANVRLSHLLGKGGMGEVWVADHLTLSVAVAVKFILADQSVDEMALARFSREATSAARIRSPHVVQVLDHGVHAGAPFIVMELLEGEDLGARIARGPLALGEIAPILQQVARALAQAHAAGIVHRDIKPSNVFLTQAAGELLVKVLDFGIAKHTGPPDGSHAVKTQSGQLVGTPCYMSPEQIFSRGPADHRIDLWALAVLAYEAVTGALPFVGDTLGDVFLAINNRSFAPARPLHGPCPPELDAFFNRAFAANPAARFASARELADAFQTVASRAPAAPPRRPPRRWPQ